MVDLSKYLLEKGADPNLQDIHGNTPLWTAIFNSKHQKGVIKILLQYGADPAIVNKYGKTPLLMFETFYKIDIQLFDFANI